jgi:hypothetical protein
MIDNKKIPNTIQSLLARIRLNNWCTPGMGVNLPD